MQLSSYQKQSLLKIAVDLVKADNQIHRNEVAALGKLQKQYQITPEDIDLTHYQTLQQAIAALSQLSDDDKVTVLKQLSDIVSIDNDISPSENILLSSVMLALRQDSSSWTRIISVENIKTECSDNQIIYLERGHCANAHFVLDDKYDNLLITKALNDVGLHLFYLPNVINELSERHASPNSRHNEYDLLGRSIGFIVPNGDGSKPTSLTDLMRDLSTERFLKVVETNYHITPDRFPFDAFLLVKAQDGHTLDDADTPVRTVDFLCVDVSSDVKKRILTFVNLMEKTVSLIPYEGYYKLLYDHLSTQTKIMSEVLLNDKYEFILPDLGNQIIAFTSSPQARSLYLLLLKFGKLGISRYAFNEALPLMNSALAEHGVGGSLLAYLATEGSESARLLYDIIVIYAQISGKSIEMPNFYNYIRSIIQHRSSLKTYINNGFSAVPKLANPQQYCVEYDNKTRSYFVSARVSMFGIKTRAKGAVVPITESSLWKQLK